MVERIKLQLWQSGSAISWIPSIQGVSIQISTDMKQHGRLRCVADCCHRVDEGKRNLCLRFTSE